MKDFPKTLVVSINAWRDGGDSNTLLNLFRKWDSEKLSQIYIRSEFPKTRICEDFFQIPEINVIKRLLGKNVVTGHHLTESEISAKQQEYQTVQDDEKKKMSYARSHRSWLMNIAREVVWIFGTWKSAELQKYLSDYKWDVVFCPIYPLMLMNRLQAYVMKKTGLKGVAFIGDDNYSYKSGDGKIGFYIHRFFLRKSIKRVINNCAEVFVMVPKMKEEYDKIFGINSRLLTKGVDYTDVMYYPKPVQSPIQIYYTGKLIYGRDKSLAAIVEALKQLNSGGKIIGQLHIYTPDEITSEIQNVFNVDGICFIHEPVPYTELGSLLAKADVVVFAESLEMPYRNLARLSFSTKITDYFKAGKCIFAVGPEDCAPIEYLKEKDSAIVVTSYEEIQMSLKALIMSKDTIAQYSENAYKCGEKYHNAEDVDEKMYEVLSSVSSKRMWP